MRNVHVDVCTLLLQNNAQVNQQDNCGSSALWIAANNGHANVCTLLLENNAQVNQQDNFEMSALWIAARKGHLDVCTLLLQNNAHVNQICDGESPLYVAVEKGRINVCTLLLENNALVNQQKNDGNNALRPAVDKKNYNLCKLLLKHGVDVNNVNSQGESILEIANATGDQKIITLIKEYQANTTVKKEVQEAKKYLKALQIKQIIEKKKENVAKIREKIARVHHLKQLLLEKQQEKDNIEKQVEFLMKQRNERVKQLNELKNKYSPTKPLLEKQNTECKIAVNNILDEINSTDKDIDEYKKEIKTLERGTANFEQQKRECEFYKKCLEEGRYDEIIKELNKDCPICFEEMQPFTKIFQCPQGHLLCENCYKKVIESTKTFPFCKRDVASIPIRNRALEEAIENEARRDVGAASRN